MLLVVCNVTERLQLGWFTPKFVPGNRLANPTHTTIEHFHAWFYLRYHSSCRANFEFIVFGTWHFEVTNLQEKPHLFVCIQFKSTRNVPAWRNVRCVRLYIYIYICCLFSVKNKTAFFLLKWMILSLPPEALCM